MAVPRVAWEELPAAVHDAVDALIGPVVSARTVGDGQNSAVATILVTDDGTAHIIDWAWPTKVPRG
jgi:hypothetical protein